jgi:hypothetical protein
MATSISSSHGYIKMFHRQDIELATSIGELNRFDKMLFNLRYLPLSPLRVNVEFRLIFALFRDTYKGLPSDFDFTLYLKKRFEKYALKTIDVGAISWFVIILLGLLNMARVGLKGSYNCGRKAGLYALIYVCLFSIF